MNIYTASKFENANAVRKFNQSLRELGHTVTWDWTTTPEFNESGLIAPLTDGQRYAYGMLDYAGVMACDLLIMLDLDEYELNGARWEAGMAIGKGADVWIVNYSHLVIFDVLPQVRIVSSPNVALSLLDTRGTVT
jgi:hypothetical protein